MKAGSNISGDCQAIDAYATSLVDTKDVFREDLAYNGMLSLINISSTMCEGVGAQAFYVKGFDHKTMTTTKSRERSGPHKYRKIGGVGPDDRNQDYLNSWQRDNEENIQEGCIFIVSMTEASSHPYCPVLSRIAFWQRGSRLCHQLLSRASSRKC